MGILYQVLGTLIICYICASMGLMFTWPSTTLMLFASTDTTLHRPMSETELALLGSVSSIGALIGMPIAGYSLDRLGRKYCSIVSSMSHVIAWAMISVSNRVEVVLTAMFISGIGGAVFLIVPVFVSEICQESIRGAMTSGSMIFYGFGMLISYLLGGFTEYKTMNYICLTASSIGVAMLWMLRESPMYLLKKGLEEDATNALAFYRSAKPDSKEVQQELATMQRALNPDLDGDSAPTTPEEEKLKSEPVIEEKKKLSLWQFIKRSRSTRRAIFVVLTLMTAAIFQGLVVVQVYAEPLFAEAVPTMSPLVNSVVFCVVTLVFGFVAAYLVEKAGRRPLMIYASAGSGLCCVLLGSQLQFHWGPHWVTALIIYVFCVVYTFGAGTVPFVLSAEVFLPEVKTFMSMLVMEWVFLCYAFILFIFTPLVTAIGLGPVFYIFAVVCFLSAVFSAIFQPETKGLPVDEIQLRFAGRRGRK